MQLGKFKTGDKAIVNIGKYRGTSIDDILLPSDMLPDGSIITITGGNMHYKCAFTKDCPEGYSYPLSILLPFNSQHQLQRKINEYQYSKL